MADLRADGLMQVPRRGQDEREHMLGDRRIMQRPPAGDHNLITETRLRHAPGPAARSWIQRSRGSLRAASAS
jgi:hypothetical protein